MTDVFVKQQALINIVKRLGVSTNVFDEPKQKCACDDVANWKGASSCAACLNPCIDPEIKLSGGR